MKAHVAILMIGLLLTVHPALAQSRPRHPIRSRIVWTAVGAFVGTAIGAAATWDDDERAAVLQRRMRRAMIIGGGTGAALGFWFGSSRSRSSPAVRPHVFIPAFDRAPSLWHAPMATSRASVVRRLVSHPIRP
jgi:hypothetical protein